LPLRIFQRILDISRSFRDCGLHQQTATIKPITRSGETARSMNPVAIFFIVFFLSFQANYL